MCCTFVLDQWILLTRYCTIASALAMTLSSSVMCYSYCKKPVLVFRFHFLNFNSHQCILHLQYFSRDIVFIPLVLFTVFFCIWDAHHCSGLRNDLYCVEWDVKLYTVPYHSAFEVTCCRFIHILTHGEILRHILRFIQTQQVPVTSSIISL